MLADAAQADGTRAADVTGFSGAADAYGSRSAVSHGPTWPRDVVEHPHLLGYSDATRSSLLCAPLGWLMKYNRCGERVRSEGSTLSMRVLTGSMKRNGVFVNVEYVLICTSHIYIFGNHTRIYGWTGR